MKTFIALLLLISAASVYADPAQPLRTGVPLDVSKTISITDTSKACGVVPVEWIYEDSQGQRQIAVYSILGYGCGDD